MFVPNGPKAGPDRVVDRYKVLASKNRFGAWFLTSDAAPKEVTDANKYHPFFDATLRYGAVNVKGDIIDPAGWGTAAKTIVIER